MNTDRLKQIVLQAVPLSESEWEQFVTPWEEVHFKRKALITRSGETQRYMYHVLEGVQRGFYIKGEKEYTIAFSFPPSFSGIPESFLTQTPSRYFLEALTESRMLRVAYEDLTHLADASHRIERFLRLAMQQVLIGTLERQYEILALSAEERFRALLKRSPHVLNMIPHKYLASYLGMNPATFSTLLGKIKI